MHHMRETCLPSGVIKHIAATILLVSSLSVLIGCGTEPETVPANNPPTSTTAAPQNVNAAAPTNVATDATANAANPNQKMLGDIPYDVWFDDPVGIVNNSQPIAPATVSGNLPAVSPMDSGSTSVAPTPVVATDDGAESDWSTIIPAEILEAEVKSIRNFLNGKLQTVGQYNSNLFELPPRTATLAVLAGIADSHPGDIAWKERAAHIRTIAAKMHEEKLQTGPKYQRPLLEKFEQIDEMLSGSLPGGIEDPPADFEFSDLAEMPFVMKRMDQAFGNMKTNAGSEAGFKENAEMVTHESAVLGALMQTILTEGYGYADDEEFMAFAKPIQDAATGIRDAVELGNFEKYDAALSAITKSCAQCHNVYKP